MVRISDSANAIPTAPNLCLLILTPSLPLIGTDESKYPILLRFLALGKRRAGRESSFLAIVSCYAVLGRSIVLGGQFANRMGIRSRVHTLSYKRQAEGRRKAGGINFEHCNRRANQSNNLIPLIYTASHPLIGTMILTLYFRGRFRGLGKVGRGKIEAPRITREPII